MQELLQLANVKLSPAMGIIFASIIVPLLVYCKGVPKAIYDRIKQMLTITLVVDETDNMAGSTTFHSLNTWLCTNRIQWLTRIFEIDNNKKMVAGVGFNVFIFKGRLFWCIMNRKDPATNFAKIKSIGTYHISTFKWNKYLLEDFIKESCKPTVTEFAGAIYRLSGGEINYITSFPQYMKAQKQLISENTYKPICDIFDKFNNKREWYFDNNKPYKETILLYGPPGTGKTNLVRHLAAKYNMDLVSISPDQVALDSFTKRSWYADCLEGNTVYLVEDIDSNKALLKATEVKENSIVVNTTETDGASASKGTLSEMLNALDGAVPLDRCIVILTTNHPDKLEKAIYRAGRVNHHIHMDYITFDDAINYLGWDQKDPRYHVLKTNSINLHASTVSQLMFAYTVDEVLTLLKGGEISTTIDLIHNKSIAA
jgi:hypothetical protein